VTIETKYSIKLSDITTVEFECKKCKAASIRNIRDVKKSPYQCPNCGENFMGSPSKAESHFQHLLDLVDFFCDMEAELPFFMKLQVKGLETENE
jgi:predicted RNA-binding Zn-ribbon protein involved in translation (DUF1610 family)